MRPKILRSPRAGVQKECHCSSEVRLPRNLRDAQAACHECAWTNSRILAEESWKLKQWC